MSKKPVIPEGLVFDGEGNLRPEKHKVCERGHPIAQMGWGPCPKCRRLTMRWYCEHLRCDGIVVSTAHRQACAGPRFPDPR